MLVANVRLKHIATAIGLPVEELFDIAHEPGKWYNRPFRRKTRNKTRIIDPPTREGKRWLRRLGNFIAEELPVHQCAHGSIRRRSNFTAAASHLGERPVITRDVSDCFPSVEPEHFRAELIKIGLQHDVSIVLTDLLLYRGRLPQGSPASSAALNLFFSLADEKIRSAASVIGGRYTRYCDDLVISIPDVAFAEKAGEILDKAIRELGLRVNEAKRLANGLQTLDSDRRVNGVRVDSTQGTRLPVEMEDSIVARARQYKVSAKSCNADALMTLARRRRKLQGHLHYLEQAAVGPAREVKRLLREGDGFVVLHLRKYGLGLIESNWWTKNQHVDFAEMVRERMTESDRS